MPLTGKGAQILNAMRSQYGDKKGKSVFYASINSGKIKGAEGKADGGAVSRLPDHYAEIGSAQIEDRRDHDPTLRAMGVEMLKKRAKMRHANAMMDSQRTEAEFVDRLVPRGYADGGSPLIYNDQPIPSELHRQRQEMLDRRGSSPYRNFGPNDLTEFPDRNAFQPDPVMTYRREPVDLESYANGGVMNFPYPRFSQPMAMGGTPQQSFNPTAQLLAQAYSPVQRIGHEDKKPMEPGKFKGFAMGGTPRETKAESRAMVPHSGYIPGPTGGRADAVPMGVKKGAYVVPADSLSGLGGGNSAAGASALNKLFNMGPYNSAMPKIGRATKPHFLGAQKTAKPIRQRFADGGMEVDQEPVADIVASHGEFVIPPHKLVEKFGDLDHAHNVMDAFVNNIRKKTIKRLKSLPPPKKR